LDFSTWLKTWKETSNQNNCLTAETSGACQQLCEAAVGLARFLLVEKEYRYVLLGQFQSDPLEERFGWYRTLGGSNYFVSVKQVLEAEKSIRVKSLVKFSGMSLTEIKEIFSSGSCEQQLETINSEADKLLNICGSKQLNFQCDEVTDANILYYISGYISHSLRKSASCDSCKKLP